jgi:hypothetical protein
MTTTTATAAAPLTQSDIDEACINVLNVVIDHCNVIRRDYRWTRSGDASHRHEFSLRDFEVNFIPRCSVVVAAGARALIAEARAEAAKVF